MSTPEGPDPSPPSHKIPWSGSGTAGMRAYAATSAKRWSRIFGALLFVCAAWALGAAAGAWAFEKERAASARSTLADLESDALAHLTCSWSPDRIVSVPRLLGGSYGRPGECNPATPDEVAREAAATKQAISGGLSPVTAVILALAAVPFLIVMATRHRWLRRLRG